MTDGLRLSLIEAGRGRLRPDGAAKRYWRKVSATALDAFLDTLENRADDVSDVMAKEVGDFWTHQSRRALDGLIVALRADYLTEEGP